MRSQHCLGTLRPLETRYVLRGGNWVDNAPFAEVSHCADVAAWRFYRHFGLRFLRRAP